MENSVKHGIDMDYILVANSDQHLGQYVATSDWDSKEILCWSDTASKTFKQAKGMGISEPVIIYVPTEEELISHNHL